METSALLKGKPIAAARASDSAVFIAGAISGVVSRTATAPLDRLKMLMQVGGDSAAAAAGGGGNRGGAGRAVTAFRPDGVLSGMRLIYKKGGFISFYQGNTANVIKARTRHLNQRTRITASKFTRRMGATDYCPPGLIMNQRAVS